MSVIGRDFTPPVMPEVPQGCGKIAYASRKDAEKAMRCVIARKGPTPRQASAYHCKACGSFHFGHKTRGRSLTGVR